MTPESLVQGTRTLFSLPDVVIRVNDLIDDPATRVIDLAEVIRCDPALSARLLKLVNSAYYARPNRVESIPQAINLIGHRELRNLVFATAAVNLFQGLPPERVNMDLFWFHSIACGIAARLLAQRRRLPESERLFIAGLLHGIGKLIFYSQCPDQYREVLRYVELGEHDIIAAERQVFGFTYADVSAELLKAWRFPKHLRMAVAYHLKPAGAADYRLEATTIYVAVQLANSLQRNNDGTCAELPSEMFTTFAELLSLPPESLISLPAEINLYAIEIFEIIRPGATLIF